jgi:hypothetical protein
MKKVKLFIRKDVFVNWIYGEHEDKVMVADYVIQSLIRNDYFKITIFELFEECGFMPYSIVDNPLSIDEDDLGSHEIDLEKYKVELI